MKEEMESTCRANAKVNLKVNFILFIYSWPHSRHTEVSGPGMESEPQLQPTPQLQKCWIP